MNFKNLFIILAIFFASLKSLAEVKIALFSVVNNQTGEIVSPWPMFPAEQRHHAVIEVNGYWYQMKPFFGVTKSAHLTEIMDEYSELKKENYKRQVEVFINTDLNLSDINLDIYKDVTFDLFGAWDDQSTSHCTKFIASIMGYEPLPSTGNPSELNLSPDDLYHILSKENWDMFTYQF